MSESFVKFYLDTEIVPYSIVDAETFQSQNGLILTTMLAMIPIISIIDFNPKMV